MFCLELRRGGGGGGGAVNSPYLRTISHALTHTHTDFNSQSRGGGGGGGHGGAFSLTGFALQICTTRC